MGEPWYLYFRRGWVSVSKTRCSQTRQSSLPVPPPGELDETYASSDSGPFVAVYVNVTSSTKPEVHNVLQCRQRRTKLRPEKIWWNLDLRFLRYTSGQIDRQTDTLNRNTSHTYGGRSNYEYDAVRMLSGNEIMSLGEVGVSIVKDSFVVLRSQLIGLLLRCLSLFIVK